MPAIFLDLNISLFEVPLFINFTMYCVFFPLVKRHYKTYIMFFLNLCSNNYCSFWPIYYLTITALRPIFTTSLKWIILCCRLLFFYFFPRLSAKRSKKIIKESNNTPIETCSENQPLKRICRKLMNKFFV